MKAIYAVPATMALVYRAYSHNSLTPSGIVAAVLTAAAHAYHPWNLPFALLVVFFLAGTRVTKVKADIKAGLTLHSQGSSGGEGPRTHMQVLANSLVASTLTLLHAYQLHKRKKIIMEGGVPEGAWCFNWPGDVLIIGVIANYAAVCADTFSSELGILSKQTPRLITSWNLRKVPRGTNGGVTLWGLTAGFLGSMVIVSASLLLLPLCNEGSFGKIAGGTGPWTMSQRATLGWFLVIWGAMGSVLDSVLGGLFQRSVRDVRSGKIVEGEGGVRVMVSPDSASDPAKIKAEAATAKKLDDASAVDDSASADPYSPKDKHRKASFGDGKPTRVIESGFDLFDNNDVNLLMAFTMSMGAMGIAAWYWGIPLSEIGNA